MAQIPGNFNASKHDDMNDYSTIPEGEYIGQIVKSEIKATKKAIEQKDPSLGQMIRFQFKIMNGQYKGKTLFSQINIINPNPTAVEIGQKELATIARACGINGRVSETEQLHGVPMKLAVTVESSANYPDKNVITMYEKLEKAPANLSDDSGTDSDDSGDQEPKAKKKLPWD